MNTVHPHPGIKSKSERADQTSAAACAAPLHWSVSLVPLVATGRQVDYVVKQQQVLLWPESECIRARRSNLGCLPGRYRTVTVTLTEEDTSVQKVERAHCWG